LPVRTHYERGYMNRNLILIALLALISASSCTPKTEAELIAEFKKTETQSCIDSWKASNANGASEAVIVSVCGCSIDKLVNAHPIEKLKSMAANKDPALESAMLPIVMECAQQETGKAK